MTNVDGSDETRCPCVNGTQHGGSGHVVTQQCGRMLSGTLPPGSHWGFFDLVVPDVTNN